MTQQVTLYPRITETQHGKDIDLLRALRAIQRGRWREAIQAYRDTVQAEGKTSDTAKTLKKNLPYFTTSGTFSHRADNGLTQHSGLVAVDIDSLSKVELLQALQYLRKDKYTFACFVSCSGNGICVIVRIQPESQTGIFKELEQYYMKTYGIGIDFLPDVSRPRFVSYDPELYQNPESQVFTPGTCPVIERKETYTVIETLDTDEETLIQKSVELIEREQIYEEGNRHNYIYQLAKVANKFGVSQTSIESYIHANFSHFAANPSNAIKWVYRRKASEHAAYQSRVFRSVQVRDIAPPPQVPEDEILKIIRERSADWARPVEEPVPVISIKGNMISTAGNITTVSGYSKSGKSGLLGGILAGSMQLPGDTAKIMGITTKQNTEGKALVSIDTEQSRFNFDRNYRNVVARAGRISPPNWFRAIWLKGLEPKKILELTWRALERAANDFGGIYSIVIDGIGDYVKSVNDEEESFFMVEEFAKMGEAFQCPVITVLHLNPGSEKQRGHMGSQLQRKSESVLSIKKDESGLSRISYPLLRNAGMVPEIIFEFNKMKGYHTFVAYESYKEEKEKETNRLKELASGLLSIERKKDFDTLVTDLKTDQMITEHAAVKILKQMRKQGIIEKDEFGNYRHADYVPF